MRSCNSSSKAPLLARALILNPELMMYDEPTTGLDPIMSDVINELMLRTRRQRPVTSIIVTHDMAEALYLADRIIVLQGGQIKADAEPKELLSGKVGPEAEALVAIPRAQAAHLNALGKS